MQRVKIGVFWHYGNRNLGDEAIIPASLQNLRKLLPEAELVGLSINPEDTHSRYEIDAFPIRYPHRFFHSGSTNFQQYSEMMEESGTRSKNSCRIRQLSKKLYPEPGIRVY